jgi:hypothetical protein
MERGERADRLRLQVRDRDAKFIAVFDAVVAAADIDVLKTLVRAPRAKIGTEAVLLPAGFGDL